MSYYLFSWALTGQVMGYRSYQGTREKYETGGVHIELIEVKDSQVLLDGPLSMRSRTSFTSACILRGTQNSFTKLHLSRAARSIIILVVLPV